MTEGFESGLVKGATETWAKYLESVAPGIQAASTAFDELGKTVVNAYMETLGKWYVHLQRAELTRRLNEFSVFGVHLPCWWCEWIADHWPARWLPAVRWGDDKEEAGK